MHLQIEHKTAAPGGMEKGEMEFLRLSMPVHCNATFQRDK